MAEDNCTNQQSRYTYTDSNGDFVVIEKYCDDENVNMIPNAVNALRSMREDKEFMKLVEMRRKQLEEEEKAIREAEEKGFIIGSAEIIGKMHLAGYSDDEINRIKNF